jgi:hypothetical protein
VNSKVLAVIGVTVLAALAAGALVNGGTSEEQAATGVAPASVPPIGVYDPVAAGEPLTDGYRPLLDRDQIRPVYDPVFTTEVDWPAESLVIGVADGGRAKAYPLTLLNQREMVIDSLGDTPILVSW